MFLGLRPMRSASRAFLFPRPGSGVSPSKNPLIAMSICLPISKGPHLGFLVIGTGAGYRVLRGTPLRRPPGLLPSAAPICALTLHCRHWPFAGRPPAPAAQAGCGGAVGASTPRPRAPLLGEGAFDTRGHRYTLLLQVRSTLGLGYGVQHRMGQREKTTECGAARQRVRAQRPAPARSCARCK